MFYTCEIYRWIEGEHGYAYGYNVLYQRVSASNSVLAKEKGEKLLKKLNERKERQRWGRGGHEFMAHVRYNLTEISRRNETIFRSY